MITNSDILDIGCGAHCLPGAIGVDIIPFPGVVVHDLCSAPYPFPDNRFKHIFMQYRSLVECLGKKITKNY